MSRILLIMMTFALLVAACGSTDGDAAAAATTTPAVTAAAPTTVAPTATATPPTSTTSPPTTSTAAPTTTTTAPPTTTAAPATTTTPGLPAQAALTHGGEVVAVYLSVIAVADASGNLNTDFGDVVTAAEAMGYSTGAGDLNCDQGAAAALGLGDDFYYGVALYFDTLEDANLFVAAYPGEVVGIAQVTTFCLD